ncbi:MAG: NUDIX hydrolase [Candidatus Nanopelagicales bacterium]
MDPGDPSSGEPSTEERVPGAAVSGAASAADWTGPVADQVEPHAVVSMIERFRGRVWSVRSDTVDLGPDHEHPVVRDLVVHPGAVGVLALDDDDRVLLVRQYRHPVGMYLFEAPAGLLDVAGEDPWITAQRELAEEAGLVAARWHVLVDFLNSPGGSTETFRCFLARGLSPLPGGRPHTGEAEELHLPQAWVPLDEAKDLVLAGRLQNPTTGMGVLAAWAARAGGWRGLRPVDAPWPVRAAVLAAGRVFLPDGAV